MNKKQRYSKNKYFSDVFSCSNVNNLTYVVCLFAPSSDHLLNAAVVRKDVLRYLLTLEEFSSSTFYDMPQTVFVSYSHTLLNTSLVLETASSKKKKHVRQLYRRVPNLTLLLCRPINIASMAIKILGKNLRENLLSWLQRRNFLPPEQQGFF